MNSVKLKSVKKKVSEKTVESYLVGEIRKIGGKAYKFSSPARRSVPDRVCVLPLGLIIFIECKRPGQKPTKAQAKELKDLHELGHMSVWVDSHEAVDKIVKAVKKIMLAKEVQKDRVK